MIGRYVKRLSDKLDKLVDKTRLCVEKLDEHEKEVSDLKNSVLGLFDLCVDLSGKIRKERDRLDKVELSTMEHKNKIASLEKKMNFLETKQIVGGLGKSKK